MDRGPEQNARMGHYEEQAESNPWQRGLEAHQAVPYALEKERVEVRGKKLSRREARLRNKGRLRKDGTSSGKETSSPQTERTTHGKKDDIPQEQVAANVQENEGLPREQTADVKEKNKDLQTEKRFLKEDDNQSCEKEQTLHGNEKKDHQNVHEQESRQPEKSEVVEDKESLQPEKSKDVEEKESLQPEKSEVVEDKESLQPETSEVVEDKESLQPEKSEVVEDKESLQPENSEVVEDKESLQPEVQEDKESHQPEKSEVVEEKESLQPEKSEVVEDKESLQPEVKEDKESLQPESHPTAGMSDTSKADRGEVCEDHVGRPRTATAQHAEDDPALASQNKTCPEFRDGAVNIVQKDVSKRPGRIQSRVKLDPCAQEFTQATNRNGGEADAPSNRQIQPTSDSRTFEQKEQEKTYRNPFYIPIDYNCTYPPREAYSANFLPESQQPRENSAASTGLGGTSGINLEANSNRQTPVEPHHDRQQPGGRDWEAMNEAGTDIPLTVKLALGTDNNEESRNKAGPPGPYPPYLWSAFRKPDFPLGRLVNLKVLSDGRSLFTYCARTHRNVDQRKKKSVGAKERGAVRSERSSSEDKEESVRQDKLPGDGVKAVTSTSTNSSGEEQEESAASPSPPGQGQEDGLERGQEVTPGSSQGSVMDPPASFKGGTSSNQETTSAEKGKTTDTTKEQGSVENIEEPNVTNTPKGHTPVRPQRSSANRPRGPPQSRLKGCLESRLTAFSNVQLPDPGETFGDQQTSAQEPRDSYSPESNEPLARSFRLGQLDHANTLGNGGLQFVFNDGRKCSVLDLTARDTNFMFDTVQIQSWIKAKTKQSRAAFKGREDTSQEETKSTPDKGLTNEKENGPRAKTVYTQTRNARVRVSKRSLKAGSKPRQIDPCRKPSVNEKKAPAGLNSRDKGQGAATPDRSSGQAQRKDPTSKYPSGDPDKRTDEEKALTPEKPSNASLSWAEQSEASDIVN